MHDLGNPETPPVDREERRTRLGEVYAGYHDPGYASRWSPSNPGNAANAEHLDRSLSRLLQGWSPSSAGVPVVVDLGSGSTPRLSPTLETFTAGWTRIGGDLLHERLVGGRELGSPALPVVCDGALLPLASASVDLVLLFTILSSIPDVGVQRAVGAEVLRILRPGGAAVVHDMRLPSPGNRNVRPITRSRLAELFPGSVRAVRTTELLPPLARRLGRTTRLSFPPLVAVPVLRSHLVALVVRDGSPVRS